MKGHTKTGTLKFMRETIWGPDHCHENASQLAKALQDADYRFVLFLEPRDHSVEGHVCYVNAMDLKRSCKRSETMDAFFFFFFFEFAGEVIEHGMNSEEMLSTISMD